MKPEKAFFPTIISLLFFFLLFLLPISSSSSSSSPTPQINVWPKPINISWPNPQSMASLSPSFQITSPTCTNKHLRAAIKRYTSLVLTENHRPLTPLPPTTIAAAAASPPLQTLSVSVSNPSTPLQHGVDESYSLWIGSGSKTAANLTAETVWGAIWGLETFSQLVLAGTNPIKCSFVPTGIHISDRPLFPHRGVMLDTSRNYYPVRDILRTIRAMSSNKLNVFHWHITDSHSFPIVLPSEPDLAKKGSYGPRMEYSPSDVKRIVEFRLRRGVRVMPEIDAPGHTGSWAPAYPDIVTCANMFWMPDQNDWANRLAAEPGTGQLNPLKPQTYKVLHNVIHDISSLFPESFYHGGADEITPGCWKTDPAIKSFLSNNGTLSQLLEIFINSTHPYIVSLNRTAVYWEDVFLDTDVSVTDQRVLPPETTILQTWNNGPNNTKRIVEAGYRVIVSSSDFYYLDCGHGDILGNDSRYDRQVGDPPGEPFNFAGGDGGSWCGPYKTWQRVYDYDVTYGLTEEEAKLVLGGEVAVWSEQADAAVLDAWLWPRAAAMAETMWLGNRDLSGKKRYAEATDRLNECRYRMVGRGIRAEPIQPLWCTFNKNMCNLVE